MTNDILHDEDDLSLAESAALFAEPDGFRPPSPPPTSHVFQRPEACVQPGTPATFSVTLLGFHSLFAHRLTNAGQRLTKYIDENPQIVKNKCILEFGAGASLPSMLSCVLGAERVVATDYPETPLINNIIGNISSNLPAEFAQGKICVLGYLWGEDVKPLLDLLPAGKQKYDVIYMSDLVFVPTQHRNLLRSCRSCLRDDGLGEIYISFCLHRPWKAELDAEVLSIAENEFGFKLDFLYKELMTPLFEKDWGCEIMRSTIYGYRMTLRDEFIAGRREGESGQPRSSQ